LAQLASENNIYETGPNTQNNKAVWAALRETEYGFVRTEGDWFLGNAVGVERLPNDVFDPHSYYSYTADTANASLRDSVMSGAGWQNVPAP
jgi:hypothetical protein